MRFRLGLAIGFGTGYYLGAKAGRERYEQLNQYLTRAKRSDLVETAGEKARAVVDLSMERARDLVDRGDDEGDPTTVVIAAASEPMANGSTVPNTGLPTTGAVD